MSLKISWLSNFIAPAISYNGFGNMGRFNLKHIIMIEENLKVIIKERKTKLIEIKKTYNGLDDKTNLPAKLIYSMILDYEFLISELEGVLN